MFFTVFPWQLPNLFWVITRPFFLMSKASITSSIISPKHSQHLMPLHLQHCFFSTFFITISPHAIPCFLVVKCSPHPFFKTTGLRISFAWTRRCGLFESWSENFIAVIVLCVWWKQMSDWSPRWPCFEFADGVVLCSTMTWPTDESSRFKQQNPDPSVS